MLFALGDLLGGLEQGVKVPDRSRWASMTAQPQQEEVDVVPERASHRPRWRHRAAGGFAHRQGASARISAVGPSPLRKMATIPWPPIPMVTSQSKSPSFSAIARAVFSSWRESSGWACIHS